MPNKEEKRPVDERGRRVLYGRQSQKQQTDMNEQPVQNNQNGMDIARIAADKVMRQQIEAQQAAAGANPDQQIQPSDPIEDVQLEVIGEQDVRDAMQTLLEYKRGKAHLE